jgi:hemin uptake protein HemP
MTPTDAHPLAAPAAAPLAEPDFDRRFAPARTPRVRTITSEQLFAECPEVQIAHGDVVYRLRQTSLGKLILTK